MTTVHASRFRPVTLLAIPAVAVGLLAGVWLAGGVLSNDFRTSMALTAAWFLVAFVACAGVARRSHALRYVVLGTYLVTAGAVGAYLGLTTLRDRDVHERVFTATPAAADASAPPAAGDPAPQPAVVELARGRFRSHEHATSGAAAVVRLADDRRFLTLTSFDTSPGPDLRVRLAPPGSIDGGADGAVDLGGLKGNRGDQQYAIPRGVDVAGRSVVIWCRAFSVAFGSARLAV